MIVGALAISTAVASSREMTSRNEALARECDRYGLDYGEVLQAQSGDELTGRRGRRWWDVAIVVAASCLFLWLGLNAGCAPASHEPALDRGVDARTDRRGGRSGLGIVAANAL